MLGLDGKVATLHFLALNVELIVFVQKQASSARVKVEDRFLRAGHGNEDAHSGNGVLLYVVPGLAISFPVLLSFFVLPPLASKSVCCILLPVCVCRSCRPENSCEGVPNRAFGAFLQDVSKDPLPGLLKPSLTVQMYDMYCGLASYGSYVSGLVVCVVIPFSSGLHVFTEVAFIDTWNFAKAPSSHRGAEGRWRCWRLLVAFSGGLHQTLSLCPCAATVQ